MQEITTFLVFVLPDDLIAFPKGSSHITASAVRKVGGADQLFTALKFYFYTSSRKSLLWVPEVP